MSFAIMCSGGDSAGMNPAIKRFVEYTKELGYKSYLIYDGLEGLIDNNIHEATHDRVSGIIYRGGTVLRTSRSKRFFDKSYREIAYNNLKAKGIDKLVVCGGDGSFRAMNAFYQDFGITFAGIPSTIDNDIYGTDYCLGVDTALNIIRVAIDEIRDTAYSFRRAFVIEVMGRDCGYLALVSALTSGAEMCLVPELGYDLNSLKDRFIREVKEGRNYFVAVVSEGVKNSTQSICDWFEKDIGFESRATILGHVQRGGSPTVFDRLMAFEFTTFAIDGLLDGRNNSVVVYKDSKFDYRDISFINSGKYQVSEYLLRMGQRLCK